jgi:hypothetical protein
MDPAAAGGGSDPSSSGNALDAAAAAAASGSPDMPYVHTSLTQRFRGKFQRLEFPTFEQMMAEDAMNNCGVRSVIAAAGGALLGVAFGIFTASLDTGVSTTSCGLRFAFVGDGIGSRMGLEAWEQCLRIRKARAAAAVSTCIHRPPSALNLPPSRPLPP